MHASIDDLRTALAGPRATQRIALVPTMGNLHDGHLALVDHARTLADLVVVSIFVNPLQFGPGEDLDAYPRTLDADRRLLEDRSVELLFHPGVSQMYPRAVAEATRVSVPGLSDILCGAARPGHFDGVTTVVCKLFNIVQPQLAVFGRKDYQQLQLIRRMVEDLALPIEIDGVATARAPDGLALSSRNGYLDADQRRRAPQLHDVLRTAVAALRDGRRDFEALEQIGLDGLQAAGFEPDYLRILEPDLDPPRVDSEAFVVLAAARLGRTRLIDNLVTGGV